MVKKDKIIDARNITFAYEDALVLKDVSLEVNRGEFVGLSGPNGAGKSTLLKLILGELESLSGEMYLFGTKIDDFEAWDKIGYISQKREDLNASFPASVLEVVALNLYRKVGFLKPLKKEDKEKALATLDLVGVKHLAHKRIGELSGGQQQRVFLARALVNDPELLIMDEATTGIDAASEDKFFTLLNKLRDEVNITIFMVSHDIVRLHDNVDRLYYLTDMGLDHYDLHNPAEHEKLNAIVHGNKIER